MGWRGGGGRWREKGVHGLSSEAQESFAVSGSVANSENGDGWESGQTGRGLGGPCAAGALRHPESHGKPSVP